MDYSRLSVRQFVRSVSSGNLNIDDFYSRLHPRLEKLNKDYNLFVTLPSKNVPKNPGKGGPKGRLAGLPVSVKDNICTEGIQTTAGSRILKGYVPPFDATAVRKAKEEGASVVGKTNQDEFGFGTFSVNSGFQIPKNPHDPTRASGGSSGGAAALTAALDFPHIALGQSTGGSISSPASFCGVFGLTPTYGRVSRFGLIDYANSLDKIGPIGRSAEDVALMLSVISGHDPRDSTTVKQKTENYVSSVGKTVKGMKIGVPKEYFGEGVDAGVKEQVWDFIDLLQREGASYKEISLPTTKEGIATYYIIASSEASTNLAKFCGLRYGAEEEIDGDFNEYFTKIRSKYLGEEAKRRIILGTYSRMAGYRDQFYLKAMKARTLIIRDFKKAFSRFDVLVAPSMPVIAPKLKDIEGMSPLQNYMMDVLTVCPNLAGIPTLSVPHGKVNGMPVGVHVMADHLQEGKALRVGSVGDKE